MEYIEGRSLKPIIQGGAAGARARHRPDPPGPARRALRPSPRHRPPRPQAPQRHRRCRGTRQGHRLRHRPRRGLGHHPDRLGHGHRAVPLARAGAGPAVSAASDLYSIGVLLYELLTGRVPFEGESAVTVALKQVNERADAAQRQQPGGLAGARRGRDAGAGEGPGTPLPDADAFIAALQAARDGTGHGRPRATAAAAHRSLP